MSNLSLLQRFKDYFNLNLLISDIPNSFHENSLIGVFVRKEFLSLSCSSTATFSELVDYIETVFSLADLVKIDANIPFLLIEDLIEFGSYNALNHLLPFLDAKSELWASVFLIFYTTQ